MITSSLFVDHTIEYESPSSNIVGYQSDAWVTFWYIGVCKLRKMHQPENLGILSAVQINFLYKIGYFKKNCTKGEFPSGTRQNMAALDIHAGQSVYFGE